jgi:hypothetical protein
MKCMAKVPVARAATPVVMERRQRSDGIFMTAEY